MVAIKMHESSDNKVNISRRKCAIGIAARSNSEEGSVYSVVFSHHVFLQCMCKCRPASLFSMFIYTLG